MRSTVGRLVSNCGHVEGWESGNGVERCQTCGTQRFTDYGALRPPELPVMATTAIRTHDCDAGA